MLKFLRPAAIFLLFAGGMNESLAQCNPVIFGEDTICAGGSTYLYVNDIYASYSWSTGSTTSYTYVTGPGTVTLNTVDGSACNGNASIIIRQVQPPNVSFNVNVAGYTAIFTNTSTTTYSYQWIFGDGTTSTSVSPTHLYQTKNNYTVCLNSAESYCPAESYCRSISVGTGLGMPTDSVFLKLYNFDLFDHNDIAQNPVDSGFLFAGQYDNCGECSSPMFIKTNKNGQVQWSRNFDYLYNVSQLEYFDSGYVFLSANKEYSITKIDLNGNVEWQKYDGVFGNKMLFTFSNSRVGVIVNQDPLQVIIYDENGNVVAQKSYDLAGMDMQFRSFARTSDGNVLLNGHYGYNFPGPGNGNHVLFDTYDQVAAKMDVNGNFLWTKGIYQNTQVSQNGDPVQNSAGEYLFPGRFYEPTASTYYYYISRFDGSGNYIDSYSIDSLKGDYTTFLSPSNNVVVVSRPDPPVYDSLRIVTFDNSFTILSSKKVTAYNCSKSTKTYDGYVATAFTYFDLNTFQELPALYKTSITANSACLDGSIPPITYPSFPYVYSFTIGTLPPLYSAADTSRGSMAKMYDDSSACRTCTLSANIQLIGGDTILCGGETLTLSAPANMYEYVWSTGAHTRMITVSAGGTYSVTVYDYRGCSATASKTITTGTVYHIEFAVNAPNGLCDGSSYSIHAYDSTFQSVWGITWNTGATGPFVFPDSSGTFVSTFVDQYGCPTVDSITVTLIDGPPLPGISGATVACDGDSVQLCATYTDNGTGPYTFSWNGGAYSGSCINAPPGNYTVTITNNAGCDTTGTVVHTINSQPSPDPGLQPSGTILVCAGGTAQLCADAGFQNYQWSTGASTLCITPPAGIYIITVTDNNGCTGSDTATITEGAALNPNIQPSGTVDVCPGGTAQVCAGAGFSNYLWNTGATTSCITQSAGTYIVTVTDASGCTGSDTVTIAEGASLDPDIQPSGTVAVCPGGTAQLCADSGFANYLWNTGATTACINQPAGTYIVTVTDVDGCSGSDTVTVTVGASLNPNIQPSGSVLICDGATATLCADAGFSSYLWNSGATTTCINPSAGTYIVTVTDNSGCTGSDTVTVTERPAVNPGLQPTGTTTICDGATALLCADPGFSNYSWSTGATTNCISPAGGSYIVVVTDNNGCTGSDTVTVIENPPVNPNIQPSGTVTVCPGGTATLCANTGFTSYLWNTGATTNCITPGEGTYTLVATDNNGCAGSDTVTIVEGTGLNPNIQPGGPISVCSGETATFCATSGFASYSWSTGETTSCITQFAGTYIVNVSDGSGCLGSDTVTIIENPPVSPNIQPSGSIIVCAGDSVQLCADPGFVTYTWSNGTSGSCVYANAAIGTYFISVQDNNGCFGGDTVTVSEFQPVNPNVQPSGTVLVCEGASTSLCADPGFVSYSWSNGSTTNCINAAAGDYIITVTDALGCTGSDSVTVSERTPPDPAIQPPGTIFVCEGNDTLICAAAGFSNYSWSTGATVACITASAGNYNVTVTDNFGCAGTDSVLISEQADPDPGLQPSGNVLVCQGADTLICASPGFVSYSWSSGSSANCITAAAGNYTLTVVDNAGCIGIDSVTIGERTNPDPDIQPSGTLQVCPGADTVVCAAAGFTSYSWTGGSSNACLTATAGTYVVMVTDNFGCAGADSVIISNLPAPDPDIQPGGTVLVCAGTDTLLCAASGFSSYSWSDGTTTACITALSGIYTVTVSDNSGCSGIDTVNVFDRTPPNPGITPSGTVTVCAGSDTTLCASAGFLIYSWSNGMSTNCITAGTGGYNLTVTDSFGCTGFQFVSVVGYQPSTPVVLNDIPPIDTLYSSSATGNQWYEVGVGPIPGAVLNYFVPDHDGIYYVIVTDSTGCASSPSDTVNFAYTFIRTVFGNGNLIIFPNPAHDELTVLLGENLADGGELKYVLYDVAGRLVMEYVVPAFPSFRISLATLAPAVYLLEIRTGEKRMVTRIEKY